MHGQEIEDEINISRKPRAPLQIPVTDSLSVRTSIALPVDVPVEQ
jgi:hypothetical protein